MIRDSIVVLDFGGQYAHLITKQIRHLGIYTEIYSPTINVENLRTASGARPKGLILSGGPESVFDKSAPSFNDEILSLDIPILGLCYGHQLISQYFGGTIENTGKGEYGKAFIHKTSDSSLWENIDFPSQAWMSHEDSMTRCPNGFEVIGKSDNCPIIATQHQQRPIFTLQFHPEVKDSVAGTQILSNFVKICGAKKSWSMETFIEETDEHIKATVGSRNVLMYLSGGVDSSVAFAMLNKALGRERVLGLFINNGFLRKNEEKTIMERYINLGYTNVKAWDASEDFLNTIAKQVDPQEKRLGVGAKFIEVRDQFLTELDLDIDQWMLGQGTLYPDIIESGGTEHSHVIKSHHNRVKEVQDLIESGHVIEPLKDLYKDEVRKVGALLGLPDSLVWRHPFPGPGLSINVLCSHGEENFNDNGTILQNLHNVVNNTDYEVSLLPVRSVGVQGDQRTYTQPAVLLGKQNWDQLENISSEITNTIRAVNRVVTLLAPQKLPNLKLRKAYCTKERLDILREADALATQALVDKQLMKTIFQLLVIILPLSGEGEGNCIVLRPVCSEDVMTAQFAKIDWNIINPLAQQIIELSGVDAVFYDVTHKPPATFGWE